MNKKRKINEFYDINKFPLQPGLIVFGISMSRISNAQSAKKCFEHLEGLVKKIHRPDVGLILLYADWLYLNSDEKSCVTKKKFESLTHSHKYEFIKILKKHPWYIQKSITYMSWNELLLESKEYFERIGELQKIHKKDKLFQKYVAEDIGKTSPTQNEINFILEELVVFYLIAKGKIRFRNEYVQDKEKWILQCYPGKPLKSEIYMFQKNFFKLKNSQNIYENSFYDLENKKLYDYTNIDLETIEF